MNAAEPARPILLPPIRYPLPSLIALVILALGAWRGEVWTRSLRAEIATRFRRAVEGPPVPASDRPIVVAGSIVRRALLLRDETVATVRPGGAKAETIDRRMFVDVYDTWPSPGPTTHLRVGNRGPIGWIKAAEALAWDTRLVIRPEGGRLTLADAPGGAVGSPIDVGTVPLPVVGWDPRGWVEVALWDRAHPWSEVGRTGWTKAGELSAGSWGVWISQVELPILLRRTIHGDPDLTRLAAVVGRLAESRPLMRSDLEAVRSRFPPIALAAGADPGQVAGRLAEANARPSVDAAWSGLSFRFLPLEDLP